MAIFRISLPETTLTGASVDWRRIDRINLEDYYLTVVSSSQNALYAVGRADSCRLRG
jgi:hypothetical protein